MTKTLGPSNSHSRDLAMTQPHKASGFSLVALPHRDPTLTLTDRFLLPAMPASPTSAPFRTAFSSGTHRPLGPLPALT